MMILSYKKKISIVFILLFFIFILVQSFEVFDFTELMNFVESAIGDDNTDPRIDQLHSLIIGWEEAPLLGKGSGINASVVRSDLPGTYELSYVALLFERGIIGFAYFSFCISF